MTTFRRTAVAGLAVGAVVAVLILSSHDDPTARAGPEPRSSTAAPSSATDVVVPAMTPSVSAPVIDPQPGSTAPQSSVQSSPVALDREARALRHLSGLRLVERQPSHDYRRDEFGGSWVDSDRNGCNQRDDILRRDAVPGTTTIAADGCDVLAGQWIDPYTGRRQTLLDLKEPSQAQAVQIDHVVPLAEAWVSGAREWASDKRSAYANDLDALEAVDGPTNASKGSSDPAAWRPRKAFQCRYAELWIGIKSRWRLRVDPSEANALREMLACCP